MASREFNFMDMFRLFEDFKNDLKQLLGLIVKNKNALADLRSDFKKFLSIMDKLSKEENMRTFRKFVNELERFNRNAERLSKELEDMKGVLNELAEFAKMMKGD